MDSTGNNDRRGQFAHMGRFGSGLQMTLEVREVNPEALGRQCNER